EPDARLTAILGERATGRAVYQEMVDWETDALGLVSDTPHLRILAGLSEPFHWSEIDAIFARALTELGIEASSSEVRLWNYARRTARDLLDEKMPVSEAVHRLYRSSPGSIRIGNGVRESG